MDYRKFLEFIRSGEMSIEEGLNVLKSLPYEDLGMAKLDHHRGLRRGFGEVIYCEGKTPDQLIRIFNHYIEEKSNVLGTRASKEQAELIRCNLKEVKYDEVSRILKYEVNKVPKLGKIIVATGGTSDLAYAEEAAQVAEFLGGYVVRLYDVGVAGIHRLLDHIDELNSANVIIAVAGMEGALASVIAGLIAAPVIGLPTSIGYGANFSGISALLSMLNSCAEGVTVVNIDNGFGAGYSAAQINRKIVEHQRTQSPDQR